MSDAPNRAWAIEEAAQGALLAIEEGRSFDHLDNVIAPALREALRGSRNANREILALADALEGAAYALPSDCRGWIERANGDVTPQNVCTDGAAELRRLHATVAAREDEIQTHSAAVYECTRLLAQAREQRGALLEALRPFAAMNASVGYTYRDVERARAAIAAVEGEKE